MPPDRVAGPAASSALAGHYWLTGTTPGESGEVPAKSSYTSARGDPVGGEMIRAAHRE
jgi:hypothetical protein